MATITEDYCDFETAKLLKEKGFDVPCNCYGAYNGVNLTYRLCITDKYTNWNKHTDKFIISCPTLQMAMKWLREVHNLHIMVNCVGKVNYDPIIQSFDGKDFEVEGTEVGVTRQINGKWTNVRRGFKNYEQACEAAIKYCLKHLI